MAKDRVLAPANPDLQAFDPHYQHTIEVLGSRWTGAIIRALLGGPSRFRDLTRLIPGLSDRMLSGRLRQLEAELIVHRLVQPGRPVRVEYCLTGKGSALAEVVRAIVAWQETWDGGAATPPAFNTV